MKDIQSPAEGLCSQVQSGSAPIGQRRELNNMLAQLARQGNEAALAQLWEINRPVLRTMFWRWYDRNRSIADAAGLTLEDFEQEGFFAVKRAAEYHDPERGSFLTALQYFVKHQIQAATIGRHGRYVTTEEGKKVRLPADPLCSASSLDEQRPAMTMTAVLWTLCRIQQRPRDLRALSVIFTPSSCGPLWTRHWLCCRSSSVK